MRCQKGKLKSCCRRRLRRDHKEQGRRMNYRRVWKRSRMVLWWTSDTKVLHGRWLNWQKCNMGLASRSEKDVNEDSYVHTYVQCVLEMTKYSTVILYILKGSPEASLVKMEKEPWKEISEQEIRRREQVENLALYYTVEWHRRYQLRAGWGNVEQEMRCSISLSTEPFQAGMWRRL